MDDDLNDYCETNLDEIGHLQRTFSLERSPRMIQHSRSAGYVRKKSRRAKRTRSCCLSFINKKKKKPLSFTRTLFAPIVTLKDLISTSFSVSSSSTSSSAVVVPVPPETKVNPIVVPSTPQSSCKSLSLVFDPPLSVSTPKCSLVHSYTSLSNYRLKSSFIQRQYSLEEQIHQEDCLYCSSESTLKIAHVSLFHAVEMYLSSNPSLNELSSISTASVVEHQSAMSSETTKSLNLCEINEIIFAIQSSSETNEERTETLDALALSLREVAEETPLALPDEAPAVAGELGQVLARAVMYEIVMRLLSFYLFLLMCYGR